MHTRQFVELRARRLSRRYLDMPGPSQRVLFWNKLVCSEPTAVIVAIHSTIAGHLLIDLRHQAAKLKKV
jgi:hypothetical protein